VTPTVPVESTIDWLQVSGIAAIALVISAFFSGSETGYMSVSRVRLRFTGLADTSRGRTVLQQLRRIEDSIMTCLIGTNLFNVLISATLTVALTEQFGARGEWLAVLLVSTLVILFGEIVPKVLYREYPERLMLASVPVIKGSMILVAPIRWLLRGYAAVWNRLLPSSGGIRPSLDRRNLAALLLSNTVPSPDDQRFATVLDRYLELAGRRVGQIAGPLDSLVTVGPEATVGECLELAARTGFSRLPITREDGRRLHGYILVRDLLFLPAEDHKLIIPRRLWRSFLLVDERMSPYELFEEMRSQDRQIAVVVESNGNPLGMITLEDLIEAVMGSIDDEFDHLSDSRKEIA